MERKMRSIHSVVLLAGIINLIITYLVGGITASVSSPIRIIQQNPRIGSLDADPLDESIATLKLLLNRIRGGGTDLDSSNAALDDDISDGDDDDTDIDSVSATTRRVDDVDRPSVIFDGSFKEALLYAKQQGRLLIAFIPQKPNPISSSSSSSKSSSNDAKSIDNSIMTSLTSSEVAQVAQRAPPKSKHIKQANQNAGSFVLWYCSSGMASSEATSLLKRIQGGTVQYKNASGQKRPILVALYPHSTSATTASLVTPRLLTQHHCSPPPTTAKFVEWLQTIRKLHKKYYVKLQKQIQEYQWEQERKHGYQSSIQSDIEAKQRKIKQELERQRLAQQEKEKKERVQQRRIQLLESLDKVTVNPSTPQTSAPTTTIALRFSDGRSTSSSADKQQQLQRTFNELATIRDVFHWIDAIHEIPHETITLQTMNGKRTFVYGDQKEEGDTDENSGNSSNLDVLLHEAGLGKMIGLRVIISKQKEL